MKIVLILPRAGIYRRGTGAFSRFIRYSPMTLATLASLVPPQLQAQVELFDEGNEIIDVEKIQADLVGITAITGASRRAYAYADHFRSRGIPVVMGGVHSTLMPKEAMVHADTVITGQAFETWPEFLMDFAAGKAKSLYRSAEVINFSKFKAPERRYIKHQGFITVNSTQAVFGCPNSCDFCVTPVACKGYQARPIGDVVADIKTMEGRYMTFVDPSPIENVAYATELYRAMIPLKKTWTGLATTRLVDHPELMDAMYDSGCKGLLIGFESLSQKAVQNTSKAFNKVDRYHELVRELHHRGIAIMGCFVHGLDGEGPDSFQRTLDFVMEAAIDLPRFTVCTPFPGTPYFASLEKAGRILTRDWSLYDAQHVVFQPRGMSIQELEKGHQWIWKKSYHWSAIAQRLAKSRSFLSYSVAANYAYRVYGRNLHRFGQPWMEKDHLLKPQL